MKYFLNNKFTLFDLKDFISNKHICKIYILADIEGKYQDIKIYIGRKTTFEKIQRNFFYFFFIQKIYILYVHMSVKCYIVE